MRLTLENTCAVVIDYQEKLVPAIYKNEELIDKTTKLLTGLNMLNVPMILTEQYPRGLGATVEPIKQAAGESPVFEKTTFSALDNEDIAAALAKLDKKYVLVCGIESHICVMQTMLDIKKAGLKPVLITDCVSSRSLNDMATSLFRAEKEGFAFATVEMVLFELIKSKDHPSFKAISSLIK